MAREVAFTVPFDIPRSPRMRMTFRQHMESIAPQMEVYGQDGRSVGIGFLWKTQTGIADGGFTAVCTMIRRVHRSLLTAGIVSRQGECYVLDSRIVYIRDGEPNVLISLKEG